MRKIMIPCEKCNGTGEIIKKSEGGAHIAINCALCNGSGHSGHYMKDEPKSNLEMIAQESELENAYRRSGVWDETISREEWQTLRKIAREEGKSYFEVKSDYLAEKKKQAEREKEEAKERQDKNMYYHDLNGYELSNDEVYAIEELAKAEGISYMGARHRYMMAKMNDIPMYADGPRDAGDLEQSVYMPYGDMQTPDPCEDIYTEQEQAEMNETYMGPPRNYDDLEEGPGDEGCPETTEDIINKPSHYHDGGIDVLELLKMKFGPDVIRGFYIGNVIKYTLRFEKKNGVQDLEKGLYYLQALIDHERGR
jgi:hypothetical protein